MPSDIRIAEVAALDGAALDLVSGGQSAWYELFYAIGEFIGRAERGYSDLVDRNGGVTYTG